MNHYKFILAMASVLAVAAMLGIVSATANAQGASNPEDEGCPIRPLEFGDTLRNFYNKQCDAYGYRAIEEGFDTRAHFYQFKVTEATKVDIGVESEWKNALILYDSNWNKITEGSRFYLRDSYISIDLWVGTYYLQTFVDESRQPLSSSYSLTLREFNAHRCLDSISIGTPTPDTWSRGYCTSFIEGGEVATHYLLEVDNHIALSVSLQAEVATALKLYRRWDFSEVARGASRRSFSATEANLDNVELLPGDYILEVATNSPYGIGQDYEILLTRFSANVRGAFDPIIGGIRVLHDNGGCTLGFPAILMIDGDEIHTLITNAHCTFLRGRIDSTVLKSSIDYAPITQGAGVTYSSDGSNEINFGELADPPLYGSTTPESEFDTPLDKLRCTTQSDIDNRCSYSDAALFILDDEKLTAFRIARPSAPNTLTPKEFVATPFDYYTNDTTSSHLSINLDNPYFTVIGVDTVADGDVVHKVGATTGWTTGIVYNNCSNFGVAYDELGGSGQLLCQVRYESTEGAVVSGDGDSGSPVFKCEDNAGRYSGRDCSSGLVRLVGIQHSSPNTECFNDDEDDTCVADRANFTSIHSIFREFNKGLDEDAYACWIVTSDRDCVNIVDADYSKNCPITPVTLETPLVDSWQEVDCDPIVENSYTDARYYRFSIESDTPVWVNAAALNGDYFSPRINILNGNSYRTYGQSLKKGNGYIREFALEAGIYLLEIATLRGSRLEDFTLWVSKEGPYRAPPIESPPPSDNIPESLPPSDNIPEPPPPSDNTPESQSFWGLLLVGGGLVFIIALGLVPALVLNRMRGRGGE